MTDSHHRGRGVQPTTSSRRGAGALRRAALILGVCVLIGLASAAPAGAITRQAADGIALTSLGTRDLIGNVALFGEPAPLPAGTVVGAWSLSARRQSMPTVRLPAPAWLFWEDDIYGAQFAHPSRILLVDDATGHVVSELSLDMWPLLTGGAPPFAPGKAGYTSSAYVVYSSVSLVPARGPHEASDDGPALARAAKEKPITRADLKHQCLITIGDRGPSEKGNDAGDPRFARDLDAMDHWAEKARLSHRDAPSSFTGLRETVYEEVAAGCEDVMLYVAGHGLPPAASAVDGHKLHYGPISFTVAAPQLIPGIVINSEAPLDKNGNPLPPVTTTLDPKEISDLIDLFSEGGEITVHGKIRKVEKNPKFKLKLKLQSCFSGWFRDSLFRIRGIKAGEGARGPLALVETSSSATEPSYFHIPEFEVLAGRKPIRTEVKHSATKNPGISEATYANIYGLTKWLEDPRSGRTLESAIRQAFDDGVDQDFSRTLGLTHPQVEGPGMPTLGGADNEPNDKMIAESGPPRGGQGGSSGGNPGGNGNPQGGTPPPTGDFCKTLFGSNCFAWVQGSDLYETGLAVNDTVLQHFDMALPTGAVITKVTGDGCTFSGNDISCPAPGGYQSIIITTEQALEPIAHATLTLYYPMNPPISDQISLTNCAQTLCP